MLNNLIIPHPLMSEWIHKSMITSPCVTSIVCGRCGSTVIPCELMGQNQASYDNLFWSNQELVTPCSNSWVLRMRLPSSKFLMTPEYKVFKPLQRTQTYLERLKNTMYRRVQVTVKTLKGTILEIRVLLDEETVEDAKRHIEDQEGTPADEQRLIFGGRQLEDAKILVDH
ncbi:hypothetical protein QBC43DRAFT_303187, partial [Cladorrhinum sp. PSN259]